MAETSNSPSTSDPTPPGPFPLPRITIRFCTQCKWMLRAAYFAQELLSTFSTSLGEVALQPSTGGTFVVEIFFQALSDSNEPPSTSSPITASITATNPVAIQRRVLWDRKADGGFPEIKELKRRVRDVIEPGRNLGHVDRDYSKAKVEGGGDQSNNTHHPETTTQPNETLDPRGLARKPQVASEQPPGERCEDCS
ncbi:Rdx family-domain-containing protein [Biscogniauxia marginata]|nr:Rdx family-domain-containing protein [Biscogniauxia marginata]